VPQGDQEQPSHTNSWEYWKKPSVKRITRMWNFENSLLQRPIFKKAEFRWKYGYSGIRISREDSNMGHKIIFKSEQKTGLNTNVKRFALTKG